MSLDIDRKIDLYFFDPSREEKDYVDFYVSLFYPPGISNLTNQVCRFSPLYQVLRDIKFCFGHVNGLPSKINYPYKAGIILINIALDMIAKDVFGISSKKDEKFLTFLESFMQLDAAASKGLRMLRNAFIHNQYSLFFEHTEEVKNGINKLKMKHDFLITLDQEPVVKVLKRTQEEVFYSVQPRKLFSLLFLSVEKIKSGLKEGRFPKEIECFNRKFNPDKWVGQPITYTFNVDFRR